MSCPALPCSNAFGDFSWSAFPRAPLPDSIVVGDISDVISKTAEDRAAELAASVRRDIPFKDLKRVAVLGAGSPNRPAAMLAALSFRPFLPSLPPPFLPLP